MLVSAGRSCRAFLRLSSLGRPWESLLERVTPHPSWALSPSSRRGACIPGMKARPEQAASQEPRPSVFLVSAWSVGISHGQMLSMTVLPILPLPLTLPVVSLWFSFVQRV